MAIRFYMNGTEGAKDGTEISSGDLSNPLVVDGLYPGAGITVSKSVAVMIRADPGETWKGVVVAVTCKTNEINRFLINAENHICFKGNGRYYCKFPFLPELKDVNKQLTLTVMANGDESNSPDTTTKLQVIGGVQV